MRLAGREHQIGPGGADLEGQLGEKDSSRALKARGLATLSAMVEAVVRAGGEP